jgi:hypothetical protein
VASGFFFPSIISDSKMNGELLTCEIHGIQSTVLGIENQFSSK